MQAKGCAPRSVDTLVEETSRHLGDWMERPLASLRRHEVATRHEALTGASGPYLANRVMQQLRAVYNTAVRRFENLPAGSKQLALWLPANARVELMALRIDADASVSGSAPSGLRRWVHHGSSISHCSEAHSPTRTWPAVAARLAGVELLNLGLGGSCHLDQFVARTMRDEPGDVLSLKAGINVINMDSLTERTFAPALHGFIDTVREGKPDTPFLIASPIICPSAEQHPGPTVPDAEGVFGIIEGDPRLRRDSLTLRRVREIIEGIVAQRRTAGDAQLHYLDGLELFGEADLDDLPDALHPNGDGYVRMGERFHQLAFAKGGPLA